MKGKSDCSILSTLCSPSSGLFRTTGRMVSGKRCLAFFTDERWMEKGGEFFVGDMTPVGRRRAAPSRAGNFVARPPLLAGTPELTFFLHRKDKSHFLWVIWYFWKLIPEFLLHKTKRGSHWPPQNFSFLHQKIIQQPKPGEPHDRRCGC